MRKLLLNLCPTGVVPTKELNSNAPITPDEILIDTKMAYDKGVQMVHIHARDISGNNTLDKKVYAEIIGKNKKRMSRYDYMCISYGKV